MKENLMVNTSQAECTDSCGCESYNRCYSDGCLGEEEFHTTCETHKEV